MADILDKFIAAAKQNVASGYYEKGEKYGGKKASLLEQINSHQFTLICEIKHASPAGEYSFGNIDVKKAAVDFRNNGADAISVVVEPQIFKGRLDNVPVVKNASGLPVLFKDFVISEEQIEAAQRVGADAVLLVVKVADRLKLDLDGLIAEAHARKLEVLLEAYDTDEMKRAAQTKADILGINNRDLTTLKVDLNRTKRIMEEAGKVKQPVISESGIKSGEEVRFVRQFGVKGVLVGTSIWKAKNLGEQIRDLKKGALQ